MKPRRSRRAQFHLPPLDADEALTLVNILERAIAAIWRAHGEAMAELLHQHAAPHARASEYIDDGNPDAPADRDF